MNRHCRATRHVCVAMWVASVLFPGVVATGDEGMWLYNQLPRKLLRDRYGFVPDEDWARHVMHSSARLSTGGSGSVVSRDGLVMTNHHVVSSLLHRLSSQDRNYVEEGFFARSRDQEVECPNVEVDILRDIEDVTARVNAAVGKGDGPGAAEKARRGAIAEIEKESKEKSGLHSEVVTLYRGGRFHLYRYKRYDDVRMVFAPEVSIAYFGGDNDNFEFPRFCLDASFVRLYEDGKPAKVDSYLRWSEKGVSKDDLVFVSGHPGRTSRLNTVDHLRFLRDVAYPSYLELIYRREIALQQFGGKSAEHKRRAKDSLFGVQNSRKAIRGMLAGLQDPAVLESKLRAERTLQAAVAKDRGLGATLGDWDRISSSMAASRRFRDEYNFLEGGRAFWSTLFRHARTIVRLADERARPNADRLPEFRETAITSVKRGLESPAPIYADLETATLTDSLTHFAQAWGLEHPLVRLVLAGRSPSDRAFDLVSGTKLIDVEERKRLFEGGKAAVDASTDSMVLLARDVDSLARAVREKYEGLVTGVRKDAYANIADAKFAVTGTGVYPDATFTLRLAFGTVEGWKEGGAFVPFHTTMGGALDRNKQHANADPYKLPETWLAKVDAIDRSTPFNFVSTPDIIGGNSGSPVVNRGAEVVGLIFDGNIHSLVLDVVYTQERARAVSVSSEAIIEALQSVYGMGDLVTELRAR